MEIIVRNQAQIANKYIRFSKWKMRKLNQRYNSLIYSQIFIKKEGTSPTLYLATIKLGIPGPDIIITSSSNDLKKLWSDLSHKIKRQLRKLSNKR